jgi:hypothetical protein
MLALPRLLFLTFFREKNCSKHKIKDKWVQLITRWSLCCADYIGRDG